MAEKRKVWRVTDTSGALEQVLVETSAEQVTLADTANKFTSTNVEGALAEVMQEVAQTGGVTGVKGNAETEYRKGNVNITKANIGLGNVDNTADANKNVASAVKATQDGDGNVIKNTYATKTEVTNGLNSKLDKTGGTITGSLSVNGGVTVGGNLTVSGTTTTIDSTTLQVTDKLIEVAHGNTTKLTSPAGLVVPKYDGTNSGALVFNGDGMAQVGKVVLDTKGNIDTTKSGLQTLATRTNLVGGNLVQYDSTNKTLVDSGKKVGDFALKTDIPTVPTNYVTTNTKQDISAAKNFNATIGVNNISVKASNSTGDLNVFRKSSNDELIFGSGGGTLSFEGSGDRPKYKLMSGAFDTNPAVKDIALVEDIKTTKVDNAVNADVAGKVKQSLTIYYKTHPQVSYSADDYNGSTARDLAFDQQFFQGYSLEEEGHHFSRTIGLKPVVTAGSYSAVSVDRYGRVTAGGKSIEWGTSGQTAPSDDLMVGGLFFQLQ